MLLYDVCCARIPCTEPYMMVYMDTSTERRLTLHISWYELDRSAINLMGWTRCAILCVSKDVQLVTNDLLSSPTPKHLKYTIPI